MKVRVVSKSLVAADIVAFELAAMGDEKLPEFSAGSHIDVHLPDRVIRQYSLCNSPQEAQRYRIAVLRDRHSRGGSIAMHALDEGDTVEISRPRNRFALADEAGHSVLLAGGIGITPLLSMAEQLAANGLSFEIHYCARSPACAAFLPRLAKPDMKDKVKLYFSQSGGARIDFAEALSNPDPGSHVYVCGPGRFCDAALAQAEQSGWLPANVHSERFSASLENAGGQSRAFKVKLASSGRIIEVNAGETVVAALARHGIEIAMSCSQGVCGTCLTRVLDGEPDHRDVYLTDEEKAANDQFLPCCSGAKSALLVLDL
jgi:vanillate O-demethylase ferredoxin subunit